MNLTVLYDMLIQMSQELKATKQELQTVKHETERELRTAKERQLITEKELNATRELLEIGTAQ